MVRLRRLFAVLLLAVVALVGAGGAASANHNDDIWSHFFDLPGTNMGSPTDCLKPPVATSPNDGLAGFIDPGPEKVITGDPFAAPAPTSGVLVVGGQVSPWQVVAPARPTIYDVYGYGGLRVVAFDDGCLTVNTWNAVGNFLASVSAAFVAATVWLYRLVVGSALSGVLGPVQAVLTDAWGYGLFLPLLGLGLGATGVYFIAKARRGNLGEAAGESATTAVIVAVGLACMMYSVTIGPAVASGITGAATSVNTILTNRESRTPADSIASTVHESALFNTWVQGTFGTGVLNAKVAAEYGPRLFKAATNSRAEQATIDADPSKAKALSDRKQADYKTVAAEIKAKYPQVYEFVAGNRSGDQLMFDLAGLVAVVAACLFLLWAAYKVAYGLVVVFLGIGVAPALAWISQFPKFHHLAFAGLGIIRDGVMKALLFSIGAIIFVVACIGGILNPALDWHPLLKSGSMLLITAVAWVAARKLGVASDISKMRQVGKRAAQVKGGLDSLDAKAGAAVKTAWTAARERKPQPTGATPAEAGMKTRAGRGAIGGMAKTAVLGAATGGAATVGAVAAAGARGAAVGVVQGKGRHRAPTSEPVHRAASTEKRSDREAAQARSERSWKRTDPPAVYNSTDRSTILDPMQGGIRQRRIHHIHTPEKVAS